MKGEVKTMTGRERVLRAYRHEEVDRTPIGEDRTSDTRGDLREEMRFRRKDGDAQRRGLDEHR